MTTTDKTNPDQPDRSDDERLEAPTGTGRGIGTGTGRPIGFWLKLVDRRISDEMRTLFAADGITRRDWRTLNLLAGDARDERLAERLRTKPHALHRLAERGWIAGAPPVLTDAGREARDRLEGQVRGLRERVAGAVSAEDFATTLTSLEAIARELGWDESSPMPRGRRGGRRHGFGGWHGAGMGHGAGAGFGHHPGFGAQHGGHDVHVHVHLHDDDRHHDGDRHHGRGRGHHGRPHTEH
ncbi:hypothetical protein [Agromyces neolithicus]|uniref:MarR family transcriptional regulator n=1 Tax=Agromyces neolithicus TaxID=269420 RepID=A0ABP4XZ37_9MICO